MGQDPRAHLAALDEEVLSRLEGLEGLDTGSPYVAMLVTGLLKSFADWIDNGSVTPDMESELWGLGTTVSKHVSWTLIDLAVREVVEIAMECVVDLGRTDIPRLARGLVEVSDAMYDSFWVYEDRAAIESAVRIGSLAESLPVPVFMLDTDLCVTFANQSFKDVVGVSFDVIRGATLGEIFGVSFDLVRDDKISIATETADGDIRHYGIVGMPIVTETGIEYFGQLIDRTQVVVMERTKDQVASVISHELRTPLTAVLGYAHLLSDVEHLEEEDERRAIEVIRAEAEHLLRLVDDLVDFTGLETGRLEVDKAGFAMADAVTSVLDRIGASLALDVQVDVGAVRAYADKTRIEQLIANLVVNASRYGEPPIVVAAWAEGGSLALRISDHGAGIPEAERALIFDSFYQGSRRHVGTGSGLGLAICKSIVTAHGGTIELEDAPGASFLILIPDAIHDISAA